MLFLKNNTRCSDQLCSLWTSRFYVWLWSSHKQKEAEISESIYCFNLSQANKYNTQTAHSAVCIYGLRFNLTVEIYLVNVFPHQTLQRLRFCSPDSLSSCNWRVCKQCQAIFFTVQIYQSMKFSIFNLLSTKDIVVSLVVAILWLVCTLYSLTVDNAILVPEPLPDHVTNRNGGLWGPVSQIWCEHVLWSNLDDQMY